MPTVAESGLPGYEVGNWYAMLGPAGLSRDLVSRLNAEIVKALKHPDTNRRVLELGADPVGSSPQELAGYMKSEIAKCAKVIPSAGIKPE